MYIIFLQINDINIRECGVYDKNYKVSKNRVYYHRNGIKALTTSFISSSILYNPVSAPDTASLELNRFSLGFEKFCFRTKFIIQMNSSFASLQFQVEDFKRSEVRCTQKGKCCFFSFICRSRH